MLNNSDLRQGHDFERMLEASLTEAMETILRRSADGDRPTLLRTLRSQMERVLAEAPITGDQVKAIALRSRMAVLFEAEFRRREAAA